MAKDLSGRTLGIIHAAVFTSQIVQNYLSEILPEVSVMHAGDDTVQRDNLAAAPGTIPRRSYFKFATFAHFLQEAGADLIMLACSTFNRAVEYARPMIDTPLLQIDRPMMDAAVRQGKHIGLLATLPSTVPSSERLLGIAADEAGRHIQVHTVLSGEAFQALRTGDAARHNELLMEEIDELSKRTDVIVMAQVSMSVLEPLLGKTRVPVLNSGRTGFTRAREILESL